ncbi:MAG TPA: hypothetical protein DDZ42_00700, partial [Candidatus Rokubacteria bacterium]|nr:hypothetical protein [Candidatus Rokubacteria bacterium]
LGGNTSIKVSDRYLTLPQIGPAEPTAAHVIFSPQFGLAQVYVAGNTPLPGGASSAPDWSHPPSLEQLEPFDLGKLGVPTRSAAAIDVLTSALRAGQATAR